MRNKGRSKRIQEMDEGRGIACALSLAFLFSSSPTLAAGIDKKVSDVCRTNKSAAFRAKYCSAAKDYKKGYVASLASSAIWGGVTTVCGLSCGKVGVGAMTCKISSMGGTAGEGVLTKKFTDALKGEGMKYAGDLGKQKESSTVATAEGATPPTDTKLDGDACAAAGTSALKSYEKISNSKQNEKSIGQLRDQTKGMNAQTNTTNTLFTGGNLAATGSNDDGVATGAVTGISELCTEAALKSARGAIACATSADPTLPGYVKTEEFLKDLQKATGKSADDYFAGFESPAKSLFEAPGISGLSSEQQNGVAESLAVIEKYSDMKVAGKFSGSNPESYGAASGSAKPSSDEEGGFDVNGAIANALGLINGEGTTENAANEGVDSLSLGANRKPATVVSPEDRTISIFDRVEWRYHAVSVRDHLGVEK